MVRRRGVTAGPPLLLGIDIGTSLIKAVLVDATGAELALGQSPTPWLPCRSGAEGSAPAIFEAVLEAARAALAAHAAGAGRGGAAGRGSAARHVQVLAVGVISLAESLALLDRHGEPVAPVIAWYDGRGEEEVAALAGELGEERFAEHTGLPLTVLPSAVKLRWLRRHHPGAGDATLVLSLAEWVAHRLGAEPAAELSLASRTGVLDVTKLAWWDEVPAWCGWEASPFPELVEAGTPIGEIKGAPAGLEALEGAVITIAGHDHLCAAAGAGVVAPGRLLDSCGTAEGYVRAVEPLSSAQVLDAVRNGLCVSRHVVPGHEALLGGHPFGLVLAGVRDLIGGIPPPTPGSGAGTGRPGSDGGAATGRPGRDGGAATGRPGSDGGASAGRPVEAGAAGRGAGVELTFDLTGHAVLSGIAPGCSPADAWQAAARAVLEQSFDLYEQLERFAGRAGDVVLTGGWSEVEPIRSAKLERFPRCIRPVVRQAGGRGAALFAGRAAGLFRDPSEFPTPDFELLSPG